MYCTEYSSNFVWHENAYNVPKLHIRRKLKQEVGGPLTITQLSWISSADEHQKFRRDQKQFQITPENSKWSKRGNALRYFDLDTDARGLKSHFLPAIIETWKSCKQCRTSN
ncbi:hypothetical protein Ocin01_01876 [Orchesella cincta]|uniref:Uncharacterized protein n=1 Tax=Orchesella cincta TaxID=48709 RepID=A0A1D2NHR5_ORCCI|nr:hypothetical protein Ocin01_01876 [Orchesella cincta]